VTSSPATPPSRSAPRLGLYAGTFDPITRGHEDLIRRSLEFVDHLVVAVAVNPDKNPLFGPEERTGFIREIFAGESRIEVRSFTGLLVDLARACKATMFIRGLRAVSDFEYEFQMALMNRHLAGEIETVFLVPSLETSYISSSLVRQVARFRGQVDDLVHPVVAQALLAKFRG
jgi:pantetheine-phosphate adenylyltransferase